MGSGQVRVPSPGGRLCKPRHFAVILLANWPDKTHNQSANTHRLTDSYVTVTEKYAADR